MFYSLHKEIYGKLTFSKCRLKRKGLHPNIWIVVNFRYFSRHYPFNRLCWYSHHATFSENIELLNFFPFEAKALSESENYLWCLLLIPWPILIVLSSLSLLLGVNNPIVRINQIVSGMHLVLKQHEREHPYHFFPVNWRLAIFINSVGNQWRCIWKWLAYCGGRREENCLQ